MSVSMLSISKLETLSFSAKRPMVIDSEEEEDYDSEMDDFIDDGEEDKGYSSYIKEIFGYDKSR